MGTLGFSTFLIYSFGEILAWKGFASTFQTALHEIFPSAKDAFNYVATLILMLASLVLACLLFRCFSRFMSAKIKGSSLETQRAILLGAPKLLVGLYLVSVLEIFTPSHLPETIKREGVSKTSEVMVTFTNILEPAMKVLFPELGSSLNLILAALIVVYIKNMQETDSLRKEAELVV